jgi:hypothetical protein
MDNNQKTQKTINALASSLDRYYGNYHEVIRRSFVGGFFSGLGATVGITVFFALLGLLLNELSILPGIGQFFHNLNLYLQAVTHH